MYFIIDEENILFTNKIRNYSLLYVQYLEPELVQKTQLPPSI